MEQIPFLAFSCSEQNALVGALRRAGIPVRGVCVSRFEHAGTAAPRGLPCTTISTPSWSRTFAEGPWEWIGALERELAHAG